jgi:hypothetical protein
MKFQLIILGASPAREQTGLAFRAANERRAEKSPRAGLKATHLLERPAKVRPEGPRNTDWKCDAHAAVERRQAAFSSLFLAGGGQGPFQTTGAQQQSPPSPRCFGVLALTHTNNSHAQEWSFRKARPKATSTLRLAKYALALSCHSLNK